MIEYPAFHALGITTPIQPARHSIITELLNPTNCLGEFWTTLNDNGRQFIVCVSPLNIVSIHFS